MQYLADGRGMVDDIFRVPENLMRDHPVPYSYSRSSDQSSPVCSQKPGVYSTLHMQEKEVLQTQVEPRLIRVPKS